jgi:hypothetical protein
VGDSDPSIVDRRGEVARGFGEPPGDSFPSMLLLRLSLAEPCAPSGGVASRVPSSGGAAAAAAAAASGPDDPDNRGRPEFCSKDLLERGCELELCPDELPVRVASLWPLADWESHPLLRRVTAAEGGGGGGGGGEGRAATGGGA